MCDWRKSNSIFNRDALKAASTVNSIGNLPNDSVNYSQTTGVFLFTETFNESIETYIPPTEFTKYNVQNATKTGAGLFDLGVSYTRVIVPTENALIKAIGLVSFHAVSPLLLGFENLAEPVQLKAGEPHAFTFTIKV